MQEKMLPCAWGGPVASGRLKTCAEDFQVTEIPACEPEGEGEHAWLRVRKTGLDTEDVARRIARCAAVPRSRVDYAGMKDRQAVTEQWFSVHLPGRPDPDWSSLEDERIQVLGVARHRRKLRRGALHGNRFRIRLRGVQADRDALEARLQRMAQGGMPNYFGPQRFGRHGANLPAARRWFEAGRPRIDRHRRGLYLSTARALLFNQVLGRRVGDGSWDRALAGEVLHLDGTRSRFRIDEVDEAIVTRLASLDVHPGGPLWGRGEPEVQGACAALEAETLVGFALWRQGLERAGLRRDRRPLRVRVGELWHAWEGGDLVLAFRLPAGSYATSLLRELGDFSVNA